MNRLQVLGDVGFNQPGAFSAPLPVRIHAWKSSAVADRHGGHTHAFAKYLTQSMDGFIQLQHGLHFRRRSLPREPAPVRR